ncbi:MAG TPA: GntR family transcriptional regulator, partial [Firmicutes bacterium]|nr:GntR family transcriptional regulator [Bacillota bacterium]
MLDDLSNEKNLEEAARNHYKILEFLKSGELEKLKESRSWSLFARRIENIKSKG